MTSQPSPQESNAGTWTLADKLPGARLFANLKIGTKLAFGFGILVTLTFLSAAVSYLGSGQATSKIERTDAVRVPVALAASDAQANLLRMMANVRGYLALGDKAFRESYYKSAQDFQGNLAELDDLSPNLDLENQQRLQELRTAYEDWSELPDDLFELRDDQLDREPAYRLLVITGTQHAGQALIDINLMIDLQGGRVPTSEVPSQQMQEMNEYLSQLQSMAKFQGNFAGMLAALRGYVTTRNRVFRGEYEDNKIANDIAWDELSKSRDALTSTQRDLFDEIADEREQFLLLPDKMFGILKSDHWREDLYLFSTQAVPQANDMQELLSDLVVDQQILLTTDLASGRQDLVRANQLILFSGVVALTIGVVLAFISRATIAGPVRRLTAVAEHIRAGDLEAQARVESGDEIGLLAETFNRMTSQLRQTLLQVRKEKRRADDLLEVVIPIGVELSTEKDFNRLLEKMLLEAQSFCHADAGTLYLRTEEEQLEFVIVRNDSRDIAFGGTTGQPVPFAPLPLRDQATAQADHCRVATLVALNGVLSNIPDHNRPSDIIEDYYVTSLLTIPLTNSLGEVLGVLQLINAQDPESKQIIPFDQNLQQMMESFSSLAVAALEAYIREQSLRQEIQRLRIEIDEVKRQQQVEEIVETDFFQDLKVKAQAMRRRARKPREESDDSPQ